MSSEAKTDAVNQLSADLARGFGEYRLEPGDSIEALFFADSQSVKQDYRIAAGDEIEINFPYSPELSHSYVVRPDGKIFLLMKHEILAAGKQPNELAREITTLYHETIRQPDIAVNVRRYSSPASDFLAMVTGPNGGRNQTLQIDPSGAITMPLLASMTAAGKTIDEVTRQVNVEYRKRFPEITASFHLINISNQQIMVFGEVKNPGPLPAIRPRTALQLVAAAGGPLPTGAMSSVHVLYWDDKNQPKMRQINLNHVLNDMALQEDVVLPANSIVYVPPTQLASAGRFINQLLQQVFLFNGSNLGVSYYVNKQF